jgi:FtsP/CotA-like multicopper oxidase with cupredoxin domain
MKKNEQGAQGRRAFLRRSAKVAVGAGMGAALLPLAGCGDGRQGRATTASATDLPSRRAATASFAPDVEQRLVAESARVELPGRGRPWETWGYGGQYPGPEIRVKEGERLRVIVENRLPESTGTTVHWHGVPVRNAMDGVPGLTQQPIPSGEQFAYEFEAAPAGTYMYHSHAGLQLDRGLLGPLIIEERTPHVEYDREYTLMLDDFLPGPPRPLEALAESGDGGRGGGRGGMMGRGDRGGGMMGGRGMMGGGIVPPYEGLLVNGHSPDNPATFDVEEGERVRLRLVNPSSATTYHLALSGHRLTVTHADGRPVEPVTVDSLRIGMGERYDVIVEANSPGAHTFMARTVEGDAPPARAVVRYRCSRRTQPPEGEVPQGLRGGRRLRYGYLQSVETPLGRSSGNDDGSGPDRTFDLRLSGGMMMSRGEWAIDGQQYPDAEPLRIQKGEHVRVNMSNMSMMLHPMHLHGHFFRVGNAIKDTVLVEPRMGRASFDFVADNPGDWFFHCHNLYHLHAGMARVFTYV